MLRILSNLIFQYLELGKQKQICGNHGSDMQPSAALEQPCAEWDKAREDLELNRADQQGGVKNTDSL